MDCQDHKLIRPKQALEILTWVSASGLYSGCLGTDKLTRFPAGRNTLYSEQECMELRRAIIEKGIAQAQKQPNWDRTHIAEMVV